MEILGVLGGLSPHFLGYDSGIWSVRSPSGEVIYKGMIRNTVLIEARRKVNEDYLDQRSGVIQVVFQTYGDDSDRKYRDVIDTFRIHTGRSLLLNQPSIDDVFSLFQRYNEFFRESIYLGTLEGKWVVLGEGIRMESTDPFNLMLDAWLTRLGREEMSPDWVVSSDSLKTLIQRWLRYRKFDGLYGETCGCGLDDLAPCGEISMECEPGYRVKTKKCNYERGTCYSSDGTCGGCLNEDDASYCGDV